MTLKIVALAFILALVWCQMAQATSVVRLTLDVPPESFVAVRFQFDGESDLSALVSGTMCSDAEGTSPQAYGHQLIVDGKLGVGHFDPGGSSALFPERRVVEVGIGSHTASSPLGVAGLAGDWLGYEAGCTTGHTLLATTPPFQQISADATAVLWTTATSMTVDVHASWSRGVSGYDVAIGPINAIKAHEFEHGAAAGVSPPLVGGASVGAALSQRLTPEQDLIGYWWPYIGDRLVGDSFCYENDVVCPDFADYHMLASDGPMTYDLGYHVRDQITYSPHYALVAIELPADSYLYD